MAVNQYINYSTKKVEDFIKDKEMIQFFVEGLEDKLRAYEPGNINMKPDVLKQMKELGEKRKKMEKKMMEERQKNMIFLNENTGANKSANAGANTGSTIVFQEEGKLPRELNHLEVVEMLMSQQKQLTQMGQLKELYGSSMRENVRLKEIIETQQNILDEKNVYISELETKISESSDVIIVDVEKK
jgi:hypothetical protein